MVVIGWWRGDRTRAEVKLEVVVVVVVVTRSQDASSRSGRMTNLFPSELPVSKITAGAFGDVAEFLIGSDFPSLISRGVTTEPTGGKLQSIGFSRIDPIEKFRFAPLEKDAFAAFADPCDVSRMAVGVGAECCVISNFECFGFCHFLYWFLLFCRWRCASDLQPIYTILNSRQYTFSNYFYASRNRMDADSAVE
jgi:hypothetical protein